MHRTRMARHGRNKLEHPNASRTAGVPGVHRIQLEIGTAPEETVANPFTAADRDTQIAGVLV